MIHDSAKLLKRKQGVRCASCKKRRRKWKNSQRQLGAKEATDQMRDWLLIRSRCLVELVLMWLDGFSFC